MHLYLGFALYIDISYQNENKTHLFELLTEYIPVHLQYTKRESLLIILTQRQVSNE